MLPKFKVLAIVVMAGFGGLCSQPVKSEDGSDQPKSPSEQGAGELGLNVFGLSLHANRSAGYNEINPGVGLRYAFWHPAPSWTVFADTSIYYDSRRQWAKYVALGESYRFAESWTVGVGVTYGQSQTYHHGKPFCAVRIEVFLPIIGRKPAAIAGTLCALSVKTRTSTSPTVAGSSVAVMGT